MAKNPKVEAASDAMKITELGTKLKDANTEKDKAVREAVGLRTALEETDGKLKHAKTAVDALHTNAQVAASRITELEEELAGMEEAQQEAAETSQPTYDRYETGKHAATLMSGFIQASKVPRSENMVQLAQDGIKGAKALGAELDKEFPKQVAKTNEQV